MTGAETISTGTGFLDAVPAVGAWKEARIVRKPVTTSEYGFHASGWALFPTERPDPISVRQTCGVVRAVASAFDGTNRIYAAEDAADGRVAALQRLLKKGERFVVPARTRLRILWDLDDYYCAYPELDAAGGKGARIRWAWTEGLYDEAGTRGNRDQFVGKRVLRSMDDTFLCDGRPDARFTTPWWRSGRWVEITVKTADEPLELRRLAIVESRYPLEPSMRFACDDPSLAAVQRICVRGLQNCMHEMFMDLSNQILIDLSEAMGWMSLVKESRELLVKMRSHHPDAYGTKSSASLLALSGLREPEEMFAEVIGRNGHEGLSTFYGYYMLEAMSAAGQGQRALDTVRDYWGGMLDVGATSFWEDFNLSWTNDCFRIDELPIAGMKDVHGDYGEYCYKGFRHSLCHGWSAGPVAWCINNILGIRAQGIGCRSVAVKPFLGDLNWAEGAMALPDGRAVRVRVKKLIDGSFETKVEAPDDVTVLR